MSETDRSGSSRQPFARAWSESTAQTIPARFEEQVAARPDAPAVVTDETTLSYRALNEAANRVARSIVARCTHSDSVAALMGQGASVIVAMIGVLKAGKIFVPLDSRQPPARIRQVINACGGQLILTDGQNLGAASALLHAGVQLLNIDSISRHGPSTNIGEPVGLHTPACLLHSSGSTGLPKAVVLTHSTMLNRVGVYTDLLRLTHRDRLTMLASCAVSQGLSSALHALLNGASLYPFDLREFGVGELANWLRIRNVTVYVSTASAFRHFARTLSPRDRFPSLRIIRLGSEEVLPRDVELYRRHFSRNCALMCALGSTEAGIVTINTMNHDTVIADTMPAGYPPDGVTVTIVDDDGRACPAGITGEITVESRFVADGYWHDPARTAAAFRTPPDAAGTRLYKTGDLGRLQPDGSVEFKGRKHLCVKIRGFRVELEEIERALSAHPLIEEAAVIASTDNDGDTRLRAFVVLRTGAIVKADACRSHLRKMLPEQMVPQTFEFPPALPRTASGKVDRRALDDRTVPRSVPAEHEPSDIVEACLTSLWEDLLGQRPIGVSDNFFEIGGNSLLAARLSVAIEKAFNARLPLASFLRAATIKQQAHLLRERQSRALWSSLVPIQTRGAKPPLFLVHLVDGNILSYRDLVRHLPPDQPVYGLQSRGLDRNNPISTRIEHMARGYVTEIRRMHPSGPFALCGWSFGGVVAFEIARQFERQGRAVALLALLDSRLQRSPHSARTHVMDVHGHMDALLAGGARLRKKLRTTWKVIENVIWRQLMLWHRRGGFLPRYMQNVTQANRNARRDYVPRPYSGHITFLKATGNNPARTYDPQAAWAPLATGGLETHEVPGTHRTMVFEPHAGRLAATLVDCLDRTWARSALAKGAVRDGGKAA